MPELHGRPDTPPEELDKPARAAPDSARTPDAPSDKNSDPRAIRDAFRRAEDPAFVDPRYEPQTRPRLEARHISDKPDGLAQRPRDHRDPSGEELLEATRSDRPKAAKFRETLFDKIEDAGDSLKEAVNTIDGALDRPSPTGQYTQVRPDRPDMHSPLPQGVDLGTGTAAMLATGLVVGELARQAYHKMAELKRRRDARIG